MDVLVIGSGGREHALVWALAGSPGVGRVFCAPGNAGIAQAATCIPIDPLDSDGIVSLVQARGIGFVVVGPEAPLVAGLVDRLGENGVLAFGPSAAAAELEGSKGFAKDLCTRHGIPTASYSRFRDRDGALAYLEDQKAPIVVKADGLSAGKGVVVADTMEEAVAAVNACFDGRFGTAGAEVVIEDVLIGDEASVFALSDGQNVIPFGSAQDHKRAQDGDEGPNTGGMGAVSPSPLMTSDMVDQIMETIIEPTVKAMAVEGRPFKGVLYAGLMLTDEGPKLIEYNVRFGDPEAQVLMKRLASDLLPLLKAVGEGTIDHQIVDWHPEPAVSVVMATKGYPGQVAPSGPITGLDEAGKVEGVTVFHAATCKNEDGNLLPTGGRVLNVTAVGRTFAEARDRAYQAVDKIDWPEGFCRRDIGADVVGET